MPEVAEEKKESGLKFFGEIDMIRDKETGELKIASQFPAWYFTQQKVELEESIRSKERQIDRGLIKQEHLERIMVELKKEKAQLSKLKSSEPKLKGTDKDKLREMVDILGGSISETQFTYTEMMKGTADAHEEAHRMVDRIISVNKDIGDWARCNNIVPDKHNRISRNQASKLWKMGRKILEESPNVEVLRKD